MPFAQLFSLNAFQSTIFNSSSVSLQAMPGKCLVTQDPESTSLALAFLGIHKG